MLLLAAIAGTSLLVVADMPAADRATLASLLADRAPSLVVVGAVHAAWSCSSWCAPSGAATSRRCATSPRTRGSSRSPIRCTGATPAGAAGGSHASRGAINCLAEANATLKADVERQVREANERIEEERSRLAALMSELAQSVVMCNIEGRILLYNARAMQLLRKPLDRAPRPPARRTAWSASGRSIFAIFDRNLIIHALESIHDRMRQGVARPGRELRHDRARRASSSACSSRRCSARRAPARPRPAVDGVAGFVLMLDNITRRIETGARRDQLLQALTQGTRASLANMRAAVETIASFPDMDSDAQDRFIGIIGEEARNLSRASRRVGARLRRFAAHRVAARGHARRRSHRCGAAPHREPAALPTKLEAVDEALWLNVDSYSLMQGITYLVARLRDEFGIREIRFALADAGTLAHLDLIWTGAPLGFETTTARGRPTRWSWGARPAR